MICMAGNINIPSNTGEKMFDDVAANH